MADFLCCHRRGRHFDKREAYITGMSFWALVQTVLIFVQPGSALWIVLWN